MQSVLQPTRLKPALEVIPAPTAPTAEPDLLERIAESALARMAERVGVVKEALRAHPELGREAITEPDLIDLIVSYCVDEFDAQFEAVVVELRQQYGGAEVYTPKRSRRESEQDRARLSEDVLRLFNGRNAMEVCRRLQIGRATLYRVIKRAGR